MNYNEQLRQKITAAEQRRTEANAIIKAAKPNEKNGFTEFIRDMLFGLGIKNIFYGIYDVVAVTAIIGAAVIALMSGLPVGERQINPHIYGIVFSASPALYLLFFLLSFLKERLEGSFEVKMTCRYTALHLCAFRMFLCGIFCMLFNALAAYIAALRFGFAFTELAAISFSSLFLFALVMIISLLRYGVKGCFIPLAIMGACLVLSVFPWFNMLLKNIPTAAYLILGITLLILNQSVLNKINRRFCYAVR